MRNHWLGVALLAAALAGGCAEDDGSLVILQAQPVGAATQCTTTVDREISRSWGTVDMAVATNYYVFPLVQNNLSDVLAVKEYRASDSRLNVNRVRLRRAVVKYRTLDQISVSFPSELKVPLTGTVESDGGVLNFGIEVLTPGMIQDLRNAPEFLIFGAGGDVRPARASIKLIINVTIEGETFDNRALTTNEFFFPLEVCNGCLVTIPPEAVNPQNPRQPNCLNINVDVTSGQSTIPTPMCPELLGQNETFDCINCALAAPDPLARQLCQPSL